MCKGALSECAKPRKLWSVLFLHGAIIPTIFTVRNHALRCNKHFYAFHQIANETNICLFLGLFSGYTLEPNVRENESSILSKEKKKIRIDDRINWAQLI